MKKIIIIALFSILLFGCFDRGQPPVNGNDTNQTNQTPVQIIIGQQQNQTTQQNITRPPEPPPPPPPPELEYEYEPNASLGAYFIYVGGSSLHGNAILIKKGDMDVLIDAGPVENAGRVVDFLNSREVDDIEVLISTNADPRNYGGINTVADNFRIETFWWSGDTFDDQNYSAIVNRMTNSTKAVKIVEMGFTKDLNGMNFEVLNPQMQGFEDVNNDAIVTRITDRNFSMLLTSGIQTGAQGKLINEQTDKIKNKVIQAPYYGGGAGTSNIGIFLITADPDVMIISGSSDESAANGGSREPFKRLMLQYGITWYENYKNGTIRVSSDGQTYAVQPVGS